jgi:hypothetical protein
LKLVKYIYKLNKRWCNEIERAAYKDSEKVSDLCFDNYIRFGVFDLLEVRGPGYNGDTAFLLGKVWVDWIYMEFRYLPFLDIDIRKLVSLSQEQRENKEQEHLLLAFRNSIRCAFHGRYFQLGT